MFQYRRSARRRVVIAGSALTLLLLSSVALSGCSLFGGDDQPAPQVVERPATATQGTDSDTPTTTATSGTAEAQQQAQPTQTVSVTTAPTEDDEQQNQQSQATSVSVEEAAQTDPAIYVVQPGDTLALIADRLGVRMDDLITLNGIQNPDLLQVGQELRIPGAERDDASDADAQDQPVSGEDEAEDGDDEQVEPPSVELPTVAVPAATPTRVSYTQFPQPGPDQTSATIPDAPSNFLQYGAAALPWLHGNNEIEPIIELFKAWPMPALAVGNDRIVLVDTNADGNFSASIIYTDPNSFGAAVPYSNLVVYDPTPGDPLKYRIAYDHAQAYAREVQGIQQIADIDITGDAIRDLTFREITCDASGCVSSFYVLSAIGDGYRTITGADAQVAEVTAISIEDSTGDGVADIVVDGLATDETTARRYTFVFTASGERLVESLRLSLDGNAVDAPDDADQTDAPMDDDESDDDLLEE